MDLTSERSAKRQSFLYKTYILSNVTRIPDYLERELIDELLEAAKTCSERDYLLLRFMWRTGVRVSFG
jgi:site-specific recombinase XerD